MCIPCSRTLRSLTSSFPDSQDRPKLLSLAACSPVFLHFSLLWWKTLHIFSLNNPDPSVTCNSRGNVSRDLRHTTQRGFWSLPQHLTNHVPCRTKCHLWVCLLVKAKDTEGKPNSCENTFLSSKCTVLPFRLQWPQSFLNFADKSLAFKKLLCTSPACWVLLPDSFTIAPLHGTTPKQHKLFSK